MLRKELAARNREYAQGCAHVESYGAEPVIVYAPEYRADTALFDVPTHGNFFDPAYASILSKPEWAKRFNKVHAQGRSLPKWVEDPKRRWRELDSCMSSDALLMNVFCTPGVAALPAMQRIMGVH